MKKFSLPASLPSLRLSVLQLLLPSLLPFLSVPVQAADEPSAISVSGYGTVAATKSSTDDGRFARPGQGTGVGKDARLDVDSNFGVQGTATLNSMFSTTGQLLFRKNARDAPDVALGLAFVKAKLTDSLSVRAGRIALPVFMISDYRYVGYASTMLRPPNEEYSQVPIDSLDGIDAIYQHTFGDTTLTGQFGVGTSSTKIGNGSDNVVTVKAKRVMVVNITAEHGPLTLRVGRADTRISLNDLAALNGFLDTLRLVGAGFQIPALPALADALEISDKKASFTSVGLALDWKDIVIQSEFAKRRADFYVGDTTSGYLMAGYRIGKFLPFYSYAKLRQDRAPANTIPTACPPGRPAFCGPTLMALSAGVDNLVAPNDQSTNTIGLRWDFNKSAAFKVQIDRINPGAAGGLFLKPVPGFSGPVTVMAAGVDFVF